MKVIDFVNWVSRVASNDRVRTRNRSAFEFVVNPSDHASPSSDTCICFDGGISVKELIRYVTIHNLEAYTMYQSNHRRFDYGDVTFQGVEVVVQ